MDGPDSGRDNEGNEPREVEGCSGSGIGCAGTNRDDDKDQNDRFDMSVISS